MTADVLVAEDVAALGEPVALPPDAPAWVREAAQFTLGGDALQKLRAAMATAPDALREAVIRFPPCTVLRCACCNGFLVVAGVHVDPEDATQVHLEVSAGPQGRGCIDPADPRRAVVCYPSGMTPDLLRMLLAPGDA